VPEAEIVNALMEEVELLAAEKVAAQPTATDD
jgi:hypothetical protein